MIPVYFGPSHRPLFGWHHPPAGPEVRGAVVICPPFGWELIRSYRALRHLALRLSASGFHVLRFDYDGTGESAGTDHDAGRLVAWRESMGTAIEELRARAGLASASLFALRLGATLALAAAAERSDVDAIVAWAPLSTGRAYLREMRAFHRLAGTDAGPAPAGGDEEAGGFLLTEETVRDLGTLDLARLEKRPAARVLLLARDAGSNEDRLQPPLAALGAAVDLRRLPGFAEMILNDLHQSVIPDGVFETAITWLGATPVAPVPHATPAAAGAGPVTLGAHEQVREEAVVIGPEGRLFGILSLPLPHVAHTGLAKGTAIVLLNNGAVHRIGSQRLYVTMARRWAALGWTVLRMDLGGLGDSPPAPDREENLMYAASAKDDVQTALDWLRTRGWSRFVLLGLCAGAHASFHAALARPVAGTVLINPQTFYWKEGDPLEEAQSHIYNSLRQYQLSFAKPEKWLKMLRGHVPVGHVVRLLASRAGVVAKARLAATRRLLGGGGSSGALAPDLRRLVDAGTEVLMIFSAHDPGLDYVNLYAGSEIRRLAGRQNFHLELIEGPDHTFTPVWSQERLVDLITAHLRLRHDV